MEKFKKYQYGGISMNDQKYRTAYNYFKPYMIKRTIEIKHSISRRGRPVEMDYGKFYDDVFFIVEEGCRYRASNLFGIPKSTFTRHVKYLNDQKILETIYNELIDDLVLPDKNLIITDTFTVPSKDGSECLGYCSYKGKKCCKVYLTSDKNRIVRLATLEPGNIHDSKIFKQSVDQIHPTGPIKCLETEIFIYKNFSLTDSGYVGNDQN
jgi:hypothetical protein